MAGPAFRAIGTQGLNLGNCAPGIPAGTTTNDILICIVSGVSPAAMVWPGGWTEVVAPIVMATNHKFEVRWKRAGASESAPTITASSGTGVMLGRILGWTGCPVEGNPIDQVGTPAVIPAGTATLTYGAITPTVLDTEVMLCGGDNTGVTVSGYAASGVSSFTERHDSLTATGTGASLHFASGTKPDKDPTGTATATRSATAEDSGIVMFNLRGTTTDAAVGALMLTSVGG